MNFFELLFWLIVPFLANSKDQGKVIFCNEYEPKNIRVGVGRLTVINFPLSPTEILPGEAVFDFKQISGGADFQRGHFRRFAEPSGTTIAENTWATL